MYSDPRPGTGDAINAAGSISKTDGRRAWGRRGGGGGEGMFSGVFNVYQL